MSQNVKSGKGNLKEQTASSNTRKEQRQWRGCVWDLAPRDEKLFKTIVNGLGLDETDVIICVI